MTEKRRTTTALAAAATIVPLMIGGVVAHASGDDVAINGTYTAVSDGQLAKTRDSYHNEATVTATWTITSHCTDYQDCSGTVVSDQGWNAPMRYLSGQWRATHTIANWMPCPDGSSVAGEQNFLFWRETPDNPAQLAGFDKTIGPSGACGINKPLTISLPLSLRRVR
jgi:hypothetical protein